MIPAHPALAGVSPLWPLEQFVAVNPFLARVGQPFAEAMEELERTTGRGHLPGALATGGSGPPDPLPAVLGPFLGSYFSPGSTLVASPWSGRDLWPAWKSSLPWSAPLARRSARALATLVRGLSAHPTEAVAQLGHGPENPEALGRLLARLPGWASALRTREWPAPPSAEGPLAALAAMVAAVSQVVGPGPGAPPAPGNFESRLRALEAREAALRTQVRSQLGGDEGEPAQVRAAFCIDVRSEPFRRAWEAADSRVATEGVAGFFGVPVAWSDGQGSWNHVPALGQPARTLTPPGASPGPRSPVPHQGTPHFPAVEVTGWAAGWNLLTRRPAKRPAALVGVEPSLAEVPLEEKTAWAEAIVNTLGWTDKWATVMAFVGHGSTSVNNPHGASLDCGACGGRTGELSARVAAAVLNDPAVRRRLEDQGLVIPATTWFVGALHNTTLDTLVWFDEGLPPPVRGLLQGLAPGLDRARDAVQAEKRGRFSFSRGPAAARDEAETRPEAALAGNAAFVVAPRALTRGANLGGRVFLHSYAAARDPDGSALERILTAPVVVATWINLQYFGSTVTPELYGGGNKVLHSRLGVLGVLEGNSGDLKPGLPAQSVFWNAQPYHEPVRLQVLVTAPVSRVSRILDRNPGVAALFDHGWADLSVRDDAGFWHRRVRGRWLPDG